MGNRLALYVKENHVSEPDLLVGDYRRRRRVFDFVLDFGCVHRTQKVRQVMGRTFPCRYQNGYFQRLMPNFASAQAVMR
jgi:hypothetical protein